MVESVFSDKVGFVIFFAGVIFGVMIWIGNYAESFGSGAFGSGAFGSGTFTCFGFCGLKSFF